MTIKEIKHFLEGGLHMFLTLRLRGLEKMLIEGRESLHKKIKREPTSQELADELNISIKQLKDAQREVKKIPIIEKEMQRSEYILMRDVMQSCICRLHKRDRDMMFLRFGFKDGTSHTLDYVGKIYGVTRERIRQIMERNYELIHEMLKNVSI